MPRKASSASKATPAAQPARTAKPKVDPVAQVLASFDEKMTAAGNDITAILSDLTVEFDQMRKELHALGVGEAPVEAAAQEETATTTPTTTRKKTARAAQPVVEDDEEEEDDLDDEDDIEDELEDEEEDEDGDDEDEDEDEDDEDDIEDELEDEDGDDEDEEEDDDEEDDWSAPPRPATRREPQPPARTQAKRGRSGRR